MSHACDLYGFNEISFRYSTALMEFMCGDSKPTNFVKVHANVNLLSLLSARYQTRNIAFTSSCFIITSDKRSEARRKTLNPTTSYILVTHKLSLVCLCTSASSVWFAQEKPVKYAHMHGGIPVRRIGLYNEKEKEFAFSVSIILHLKLTLN